MEGTVEGELLRPRAHVVVRGVHSVDPVYMVAMEGFAPELPGSVTARFNDGTEEQLSVQWEPVSEKTGTVTVSGNCNRHRYQGFCNDSFCGRNQSLTKIRAEYQ